MIKFFDGEYAFLSNYYDSPFTYEGIEYKTNEHFFQAMKSYSIEERQAIAAADTPGQAKRMGRKVTLRPDWEEIKDEVMLLGLRLKFCNIELREKLRATGDKYLEEGNTWHDNTWGACCCPECAKKKKENRLGKLLMQVRSEI